MVSGKPLLAGKAHGWLVSKWLSPKALLSRLQFLKSVTTSCSWGVFPLLASLEQKSAFNDHL